MRWPWSKKPEAPATTCVLEGFADAFAKQLTARDTHFSSELNDRGDAILRIPYRTDAGRRVTLLLQFDRDENVIRFYAFGYITATPAACGPALLRKINEINRRVLFYKFYLDDDRDIVMCWYFPYLSRDQAFSPIGLHLYLMRSLDVLDKLYGEFSQVIEGEREGVGAVGAGAMGDGEGGVSGEGIVGEGDGGDVGGGDAPAKSLRRLDLATRGDGAAKASAATGGNEAVAADGADTVDEADATDGADATDRAASADTADRAVSADTVDRAASADTTDRAASADTTDTTDEAGDGSDAAMRRVPLRDSDPPSDPAEGKPTPPDGDAIGDDAQADANVPAKPVPPTTPPRLYVVRPDDPKA